MQPAVAIWISVVLVVVTGMAAVFGLLVLESRRRVRREARRMEDDIVSRAYTDPALRGIRVTVVARMPVWRGAGELDVEGTVGSATQRDAVLAIARQRAAATRRRVRVNDAVRVVPMQPPRRGEVA
jgi:hypothetical protein